MPDPEHPARDAAEPAWRRVLRQRAKEEADALAAARKEGREDVFALLANLEKAEEETYQAMKHGRAPHDAYGPAAHEYASQLLEIFIAHNATPATP